MKIKHFCLILAAMNKGMLCYIQNIAKRSLTFPILVLVIGTALVFGLYYMELFTVASKYLYFALALMSLLFLFCIIYVVYNICLMARPWVHRSVRDLSMFGLEEEDIQDIDWEVAHESMLKTSQMFVTDHFLVIFAKHDLAVIPLYNIVWGFASGRRITIVTSPKHTFRQRGSRSDIRRVLKFFDEDFSHIAVGYSKETKEHMKKVL